MKQEIQTGENEYSNSYMEISQPEEFYQGVQDEISMPANEISSERYEQFVTKEDSQISETDKKEKRAKKEKLHKKLISKMSYTVACAVAVITIAQVAGMGSIEDNVIAAGGSVDADMRFTIQWNDGVQNPNDFDAHCLQPNGNEIFFGNPVSETGSLDVDIINPVEEQRAGIENIVYLDKKEMEEGTYLLYVHCYKNNGGRDGFKAQIEIDNRVYNFHYGQSMETGEIIYVAEVSLKNGRFEMKELMTDVYNFSNAY